MQLVNANITFWNRFSSSPLRCLLFWTVILRHVNHIILRMLEVIDYIIYCSDQDTLKSKRGCWSWGFCEYGKCRCQMQMVRWRLLILLKFIVDIFDKWHLIKIFFLFSHSGKENYMYIIYMYFLCEKYFGEFFFPDYKSYSVLFLLMFRFTLSRLLSEPWF